jgi:peptide/nickel transport system ATP-binding protein
LSETATDAIVQLEHVTKYFPVKHGVFARSKSRVHAVEDVSLTVRRGETLGIVGESGCGKSTTARLMLRLIDPTGGTIKFDGRDITGVSTRGLRPLRREMQMIFQDPYASLNPRKTVEQIVLQPFAIHGGVSKREAKLRVRELLQVVGLSPEHASRYPHEFSGGQRQRIGIARALALNPKLIVCDEPVSALDVSVQAQILNLLVELQREFGLSYLFISHDLGVVRHISDRIAVMYLGRIVEIASRDLLFAQPGHPYTELLLASAPPAHPRDRRRYSATAEDVPSATRIPPGCPFNPRCPLATERCRAERPALTSRADGRLVACHNR